MPLAAGIFADADLWAERRAYADYGDAGGSVTAYLRSEQELGRVRPDVEVEAIAQLLLDACLGRRFLDVLADREHDAVAGDAYARALVELLIRELEPR